ncbi:MAG: winged helix-turn-helix transcriptional regulator, partial [Bacteroidales bacterium]|nr:winged helix-turn-helix transcriptional regulator [Bacteroidales bacterium]
SIENGEDSNVENNISQKSWEKTENGWEKTEKSWEKNQKSWEKSQKSWEKIVAIMKENPNISTMDLVNMLNISQTAVENQLKKLRERNIIKRIGPDKGGYWVVLG